MSRDDRHRQVPQIGQGPKRFAPDTRGPIQSPMMAGQPIQPQAAPEESIAQDMEDMAMEIYCRIVSQHICAGRASTPRLIELAADARLAATIFFEQENPS